jgi:hypothetical protein
MSRTVLMLTIAGIFCLLLCLDTYAQKADGDAETHARKSRLQRIDAEFHLRMGELQLKMAELAESEAKVELEKIELHLQAVKEQGSARDAAHVQMELKQAAIRLEMRSTETEIARLRIEHAKARFEANEALQASDKDEHKPTAVRLESVEGLDVVIIRGSKKSVEKVRAVIEAAQKEKK